MNDHSLSSHREQLQNINQNIFDLLNQRKEIINQLFNLKKKSQIDEWVPEQEKEVFTKIIESYHLDSITEMGMISFLIESQVSDICETYPKWSEGVHIEQFDGSLAQRINPVLLMLVNETEYSGLNLKPKYLERMKQL